MEQFFIKNLETRLDTILYRAKFVDSIRKATQIIGHGKIFVNNKLVKSKAYRVKSGDIITTNFLNQPQLADFIFGESERDFLKLWPVPPKHLHINYITMQIVILKFEKTSFTKEFHFSIMNRYANIAINNFLYFIF